MVTSATKSPGMDRRRFLLTSVAGVLAAPLAAEAQQAGKKYRIGCLYNGNPTQSAPTVDAFREGMRELGWVDGQNVSLEYRWADGNLDRLPALVTDLVRLPVDVIHLAGGPAIRAARQATRTIPIVVALMSDPVVLGFVTSFARPGGTITGLAVQFEGLASKQMQLVKETTPNAARVAILDHYGIPNPGAQRAAETAARALGLTVRVIGIRDESDLQAAFRTAKAERADAMYVLPSPTLNRHRARLAELAMKHRGQGVRGCRRIDVLWPELSRSVPPFGELCRSDPQAGAGGSGDRIGGLAPRQPSRQLQRRPCTLR